MAHLTELQVENIKSHMMRDEDALKIKFKKRWVILWFVLLLVKQR